MPKSHGNIAIVTGTRAEFGLLEPVIAALTRRGRRPALIVTGMHLLPKFGRTIDEIRGNGYRIDATVKIQTGRDDGGSEAAAVARGIDGIARVLDRLGCKIVVVLGDRIEAFAGACAGAISRRVVAHIHGGDRAPGDIDDPLRNAITRLAHVHLAASQDAVDRLARMGEPLDRIHLVGAPGLDAIRTFLASRRLQSMQPLDKLIGSLATKPYAVVVQHSCGRKPATEAAVMRNIVQAVERNRLHGVAIWPNSDPGHDGIIRELRVLDTRTGWRSFRSLIREDYLRLVHGSAVLVGNSSSGIIESASLGVRAVNVGTRQAGRLRCGSNVLDVAESAPAIERAIKAALRRPRPESAGSVYGDGRAGERIARVLEKLRISPALLRKELTF